MIQDDFLFAQTRTFETIMGAIINVDAATGYQDIRLRKGIETCQIRLNLIQDFVDIKQGEYYD